MAAKLVVAALCVLGLSALLLLQFASPPPADMAGGEPRDAEGVPAFSEAVDVDGEPRPAPVIPSDRTSVPAPQVPAAESDALAPGEYQLSVVAPGHAPVIQPVHAFAGTRSTVLVQLEEGYERSFLVEGTDYSGWVDLIWKNERGQTFFRERVEGERHQRGPLEIERIFAPGTYRVSVLRYGVESDAVEIVSQVHADSVDQEPVLLRGKPRRP